MSKLLAELMGADGPVLAETIARLEQTSGFNSVDVRLSADIVRKVQHQIRALGLDPHDTNGRELYYALMDVVYLHDEFLARLIGGKNATDVADLLPKIVHVARKVKMPRQVWALKHSVGKRLLQSHPPKQLMKKLGYRSLDSMLKRESIAALFGALDFSESAEWYKQFLAQYRGLSPSDFEVRDVEIVMVDNARWAELSNDFTRHRHHNIALSKEMGAILVLRLPVNQLPGVTIMILSLLLHQINELRAYGAYFKLQQVKPDFGEQVAKAVKHQSAAQVVLAGHQIPWAVLHRHFGRVRNAHPEVFEPHIQADDLEWRSAEHVLFYLEPALQFWHEMDYVGVVKDGQRISFNLIDAATNYLNQLSFNQQVSYHLQNSLWNEFNRRYVAEPAIEAQLLRQLDEELLTEVSLPIGEVRL